MGRDEAATRNMFDNLRNNNAVDATQHTALGADETNGIIANDDDGDLAPEFDDARAHTGRPSCSIV